MSKIILSKPCWILTALCLAAAIWLLAPVQAVWACGGTNPTVLCVDADAPGSATGLSWTDAYTNVQDALDLANSNAGTDYEIWVAEGVYYPDVDSDGDHTENSINESFTLRYNNVQLYGGFAAAETSRTQRDWAAHVTVLSGDVDGNDTNADGNFIAETWNDVQGSNAYHVLWLDGVNHNLITANTVIDGFTITAGYADDTYEDGYGGGVYCDGTDTDNVCSPALTNVIFSGNRARFRGGGMYSDGDDGGTSSPALTDVIFSGNQAGYGGGGMCTDSSAYEGTSHPTLTNVLFIGNQTDGNGGGLSNLSDLYSETRPTLTGVTFSGNQAGEDGGGMYNDSYDSTTNPTLTGVTFSDNHAGENGGGMYSDASHGGDSSPTLTHVTFSGNQAAWDGGGMNNHATGDGSTSSPALTNVLFSGNRAGVEGGGMHNYASADAASHPTLINVTFSGNQAGESGGGMYNAGYSGTESSPTLTNCILWANTAVISGSQIYNDSASATLNYSLVQGGCPTGATCDANLLTVDPQFVAPVAAGAAPTTAGDYRLQAGSPAVDAGDTSAVVVATDLDGNPRVQGTAVDVGAYELPDLALSKTVTPTVNVPYHGTVTYTVALSNRGETDHTGVLFTDTLPAEVDFAAWHTSPAGTDLTGNVVTWMGTVPAGGALTWTFTAFHTGNYGDVVTNTAEFSSALQTEGASDTFFVQAPELALSKTVTPTTDVAYHGTVTYTVTLSNSGALSDTGVLFTDTLPGQVDFAAWVTAPPGTAVADDVVTWMGTVPAGEALTWAFVVVHTGDYGEVVTNTAQFSGLLQADADPAAFFVEEPPVLYVDADAPAGGDGLSWSTAYRYLQDALDRANAHSTHHYEIWVAEGVYYPDEDADGDHTANSHSESFTLRHNNVQLYGGFAGTEALRTQRDWDTNTTILSGDIDHDAGGADANTDANFIAETWDDIQGNNVYHVLWLDGFTNQSITETTVIDGFIITAGQADGSHPHNDGGGLYCDTGDSGNECSPLLANVIFSGNQATYDGGGMYNYGRQSGASNPVLDHVTFSGNRAGDDGGGMFNDGAAARAARCWTTSPSATTGPTPTAAECSTRPAAAPATRCWTTSPSSVTRPVLTVARCAIMAISARAARCWPALSSAATRPVVVAVGCTTMAITARAARP